MLRKFIKFILTIPVLFSCSFVNAETLTLVTLESPPAEYIENGEPTGINVDIAKEGLRRMGYDSKVLIVPWKRALHMVKNGTADGIIDAAYSEERAEYLHYPDQEIYVEEWYCFNKKNSGITLDDDLTNARNLILGVSSGFVYGGIIQDAIERKLFKRMEEIRNNELNIKMVANGRIDVMVGVKSTILFLAKKMGYSDEIEITKKTSTNDHFLLSSSKTYLGFSKKRIKKEFADRFSEMVAEMKMDGTIDKILMTYQ